MEIEKYRRIARETTGVTIDVPGEPYYTVRTKLAELEPGEWYWHLALVHYLTGAENVGKHNLFLEAIDENGISVRGPLPAVGWTWKDRRDNEQVRPIALDKPANEPGGNIDIYWGQRIEAWVTLDGLKSDRVYDVHTMWPDGHPGNTRGHHSALAVWVKRRFAGSEPEPDPQPGTDRAPALLAELAAWYEKTVQRQIEAAEELDAIRKRYEKT